jgi:hypothetical protein
MYIISHRGNLEGPNPKKENNPVAIHDAIELGYFVEVDLWDDGAKTFIGHDGPQYEIQFSDFSGLPIFWHAKNLEAAHLAELERQTWFAHDKDPYALVRTGKKSNSRIRRNIPVLWGFPETLNDPNTICYMVDKIVVIPGDEVYSFSFEFLENIAGICTDYPIKWTEYLKDLDLL